MLDRKSFKKNELKSIYFLLHIRNNALTTETDVGVVIRRQL